MSAASSSWERVRASELRKGDTARRDMGTPPVVVDRTRRYPASEPDWVETVVVSGHRWYARSRMSDAGTSTWPALWVGLTVLREVQS